MKFRDWAQRVIYKIIDPVVHGLVKMGITPNIVTTTGLFFNIVAAGIFLYGGVYGKKGDFFYIGWAGGVILFAGLFDMLDGQVARIGGMSSRYGALYDSVLDRYSELIVFFGICSYLITQGYIIGFIIAFIALVGSLMVSYVRARAEGLGIECKVGFMQRPERVVLTAVGALGCGIAACFVDEGLMFNPIYIFETALFIIAIFSNVTAFARLNHCRKVMNI
ncbi:CDP-alcohol phosphatidyltransferase family protein [Coprobacter sp.]